MAKSEALATLIKKAEEIAARGGKPFATNVRPKAKPGDPNFVGPVEQIGPNQLTPQTRIGPPERQGPPEMQGPRQLTPQTFIGPAERQGPQLPRSSDPAFIGPRDFAGPRELPRSTDLRFIGPREQIGPQIPRPGDPNFIGPMGRIGPSAPTASATMPSGSSGSYLPLFAGSVLGGTALLSGGQQTQDRMRREADQQAAIEAARKMTDFDQSAPNTFSPEEAIRIASVRPEFNQTAPNTFNTEETAKIARAAAPAPRERAAPPMPPARPEELRARPGGLASLFSDPYAGKSSRELYEMAQNMRDDEYGANLLNIRAARVGRDEGYASGGAATGKSGKMEKDAALHKALDIIAHMLGRQ